MSGRTSGGRAYRGDGPLLELKGVSVVYPGTTALDAIDLEVGPDERVALVGPSGAGKSTVIGLCNGTVVPTTGQVQILGRSLMDLPAEQLRAVRSRVATVHQGLHLVGQLRVIHNVNAGHLGEWSSWKAISSLIRPRETAVAVEALARMGVDHKVNERTGNLSGGEQQRVALARVLVQDPDLVLADEPVSSLDPERAREVMRLLGLLVGGGRSLLVSLHAFDLAREFCDRMVGLRSGRIIFDKPARLVEDREAARLYRIGDG